MQQYALTLNCCAAKELHCQVSQSYCTRAQGYHQHFLVIARVNFCVIVASAPETPFPIPCTDTNTLPQRIATTYVPSSNEWRAMNLEDWNHV